jgi:hypothetical protein
MKLPKKAYFGVACLLFVGGVVTATALIPHSPKEVTLKQSSSVVPSIDDLPTATGGIPDNTTSAPTEHVTQQTTETPAPQESLQDEVKRKVEASAIERDIPNPEYQSMCMDQLVLRIDSGYQNEAKVREALALYVVGNAQEDGLHRMYFGSSCRIYDSVS